MVDEIVEYMREIVGPKLWSILDEEVLNLEYERPLSSDQIAKVAATANAMQRQLREDGCHSMTEQYVKLASILGAIFNTNKIQSGAGCAPTSNSIRSFAICDKIVSTISAEVGIAFQIFHPAVTATSPPRPGPRPATISQ